MNAPSPAPVADAESFYANYDHLDTPLGPDGTPFAYYEAFRDAALAADQPVGWSEKHGGFWVVTSFADCERIDRDAENFSNDGIIFPKYAVTEPLMLAEQDEPEHMRARRLVNLAFMPRGVTGLSEAIHTAVHELMDGFIETGRADVGRILADPVPSILTAVMLGFPPEDGPMFDSWTTALTHEFITDRASALPKIAQMYEYFERNIARRQKEPGTDILSQVINTEIDGERLSQKELLGFSTVLLIGGIENSAKLIGTALWRLGWDVELRRRLVRSPEKMNTAVDEFLRYYTPAPIGRTVKREVTIGGRTMKPGQQVMIMLPVANRDPRTFPHPDVFILDRARNTHLALGTGLHVCLGQHLIRMEARVVLNEFLSRIPEYSIDMSAPRFWTKGQVQGMSRVPIVFEPGKPRLATRGAGVDAWLRHAARP
ncbi:MAG: cytochrome P450 [Panacagrimonas sp.]